MSIPEHVKCIQDIHVDNQGKSWCGRYIGREFAFTGIDHAALNGRNGGFLVACKACTEAVIKSLSNGQDEE